MNFILASGHGTVTSAYPFAYVGSLSTLLSNQLHP
jgi:hypothetical protein